jgi:hypothetical protein
MTGVDWIPGDPLLFNEEIDNMVEGRQASIARGRSSSWGLLLVNHTIDLTNGDRERLPSAMASHMYGAARGEEGFMRRA